MKYGVLNQKNPEYKPALWQMLDDLYVGGFQILANAKRYIPRQVGENDQRYDERLKLASYVNYLGGVVESYVGNLFTQEPIVTQAEGEDEDGKRVEPPTLDSFWGQFSENANLKGESFAKLLRCAFTSALINGRALVACDFPASDIYPETRAEEDELGLSRAYAFDMPLEELIDWEYSERVTRKAKLSGGREVEYTFGRLSWAIIRREISVRATPQDSRSTFVEEFRVWSLTEAGAKWELYRTPPRRRDEPDPMDDDDVPLASEAVTSFAEIPILEMCIPPGLWLGNKLGPLALNLFQRRSSLLASLDRGLFPVACFKQGPEVGAVGGALPPDVQQNPGRGREAVDLDRLRRMGSIVMGYQDEFEYVEPEGRAQELADKKLTADIDEFYRIASMMASSISNTASALGRSGASKSQDHRDMAIVLEAYAAIVSDFATRVYDLIEEARGEDITWTVHGLDKFDTVDRATVLDEAKSMSLVSIPSKSFRVQWQYDVAMSLLGNVTPEMQRKIRAEIEDGVEAEEEIKSILTEADAAFAQKSTETIHGEDDEPTGDDEGV